MRDQSRQSRLWKTRQAVERDQSLRVIEKTEAFPTHRRGPAQPYVTDRLLHSSGVFLRVTLGWGRGE